MRNTPNLKAERYRVTKGPLGSDSSLGNNGMFVVPVTTDDGRRVELTVVVSDQGSWDHVSVSHPHRDPSWREMDQVKALFFRDDETVLQFHVPRAMHISNHDHCLHLWRPHGPAVALPPSWMVGTAAGERYAEARRAFRDVLLGVPGAAEALSEAVGCPPPPQEASP